MDEQGENNIPIDFSIQGIKTNGYILKRTIQGTL